MIVIQYHHHHHHQLINVPNVKAQVFLMDRNKDEQAIDERKPSAD
jgi:hypothetical protein